MAGWRLLGWILIIELLCSRDTKEPVAVQMDSLDVVANVFGE
jgi:hypothetical protein